MLAKRLFLSFFFSFFLAERFCLFNHDGFAFLVSISAFCLFLLGLGFYLFLARPSATENQTSPTLSPRLGLPRKRFPFALSIPSSLSDPEHPPSSSVSIILDQESENPTSKEKKGNLPKKTPLHAPRHCKPLFIIIFGSRPQAKKNQSYLRIRVFFLGFF